MSHDTYPASEDGVEPLGQRHFVLPMNDRNGFLWWHDCPEIRAWGWIGDVGDGRKSGHHIKSSDPITVGGSLICRECGDHGFITNGKWVRA